MPLAMRGGKKLKQIIIVTGKPVSCKDFFPSEDAETFSPLVPMKRFLKDSQLLPCFSPPGAGAEGRGGLYSPPTHTQDKEQQCVLSGQRVHFFSLAPLSCASKMVGELSFRRAEELLSGVMSSQCL